MENLGPSTTASDRDRIGKLRSLARKMDELAADFEDLDLFMDADQIRDHARKIRGQARIRKSDGILRIVNTLQFDFQNE